MGNSFRKKCCKGAVVSLRTIRLWIFDEEFYGEDNFLKEKNIFIHSCKYENEEVFEQKIYKAIEEFKQEIKINFNYQIAQIKKNISMNLYAENIDKKYGE